MWFFVQALSPLATCCAVQTYRLTAQAGFRVNDITVEGRKRTQRDDLLVLSVVVKTIRFLRSIWTAIHARIEALPWVERATVLRRLPNIIACDLNERERSVFIRQ